MPSAHDVKEGDGGCVKLKSNEGVMYRVFISGPILKSKLYAVCIIFESYSICGDK